MEVAQVEPTSKVDSQQVWDLPAFKFTWKIENFSKLTAKKLYSDVFSAGSYKWRVLIFPKGNNVDNLSIYLDVADSVSLPPGWSRLVHFSMAVVNQVDRLYYYTIRKETEHHFNAKESDWGFTSFMSLSKLYDPSNGFLVNDTIVIDVEVYSKPSSGAHTIAASTGVTIPAEDDLNDLYFSDEEPCHKPVAPANSIDDLPPSPEKVEAARDLILSILSKKSLHAIVKDMELFTDALKTIKVAVPPAQAEHVEKMLKVAPRSAYQLEAANKRLHEAKAILNEHEELDATVKTDSDAAKQMKADQQAKTAMANKLVSDIVAKEAELAKLKQELCEMGDIKKGNEAVRKAYADCAKKKEALKVLSAKVADAEAQKRSAAEDANKVLQEWEAYVEENVELL